MMIMRNFEADPNLGLRDGRSRAMRLDSLQDSAIEQITFQSQYVTAHKDSQRCLVPFDGSAWRALVAGPDLCRPGLRIPSR